MKKANFIVNLMILSLLSNFAIGKELSLKSSSTKLKANINYEEFTPQDQIPFGKLALVSGLWSGNYKLEEKSIYWINSEFNKDDILSRIKLGPYKIQLKFTVNELGHLLGIDIVQKGVQYESNGFQIQNENQFNYWTTAKVDDWIQVIRGKVYRISKEELLTVFQTVVYERKIPIYAFEGIAILNKVQR